MSTIIRVHFKEISRGHTTYLQEHLIRGNSTGLEKRKLELSLSFSTLQNRSQHAFGDCTTAVLIVHSAFLPNVPLNAVVALICVFLHCPPALPPSTHPTLVLVRCNLNPPPTNPAPCRTDIWCPRHNRHKHIRCPSCQSRLSRTRSRRGEPRADYLCDGGAARKAFQCMIICSSMVCKHDFVTPHGKRCNVQLKPLPWQNLTTATRPRSKARLRLPSFLYLPLTESSCNDDNRSASPLLQRLLPPRPAHVRRPPICVVVRQATVRHPMGVEMMKKVRPPRWKTRRQRQRRRQQQQRLPLESPSQAVATCAERVGVHASAESCVLDVEPTRTVAGR